MENKPLTTGYKVEQTVTAGISELGVGGVDANLTFRHIPIVTFFGPVPGRFAAEDGITIYCPFKYNYAGIDLFLVHNQTKTQRNKAPQQICTIMPVQITTNKARHSDSEQKFVDISKDLRRLAPSGSEVQFEFWWATRQGQIKNPGSSKKSLDGVDYKVREISFGQIHPGIEDAVDGSYKKYKPLW